jgi:hypothetical protein
MVIVFLADPLAIALLTAYHFTQKVILEEDEKDSDNIEENPIPKTPKERSPLAEFYSEDLTKEDTKYIDDFNEKVKFTSSFVEFTSSFEHLISGSIVPTNPNNYQGDFSWSRSIEAFPKPKRRGRPTGSKNKVKNNSIESINEFEDMTIVKGSFNEIYEYSDEVLPEQIKLEEVVTGSFDNFAQEESKLPDAIRKAMMEAPIVNPKEYDEILMVVGDNPTEQSNIDELNKKSELIEEDESDMVEDITFEAIDEDYDISSGEPEEEIIIIPSTNKSKSRNYREPKTDVKKNFLNRN